MIHRRVGTLTAIVALLGLAAGSASAQTLYGITWNNELIIINPTTGAGTLVGGLSSNMMPLGVAFRGSKLYTWDQVAKRIRELDPATGATLNTTDIGLVAAAGEGDLAFRSDGSGFLVGWGPGPLIGFDITVPSSISMGTINETMDGLAFNAAGVLYGISQSNPAQGSTPTARLYTINQTTGAVTLVGDTGLSGFGLGGLAFDSSGNLYAALSTTVSPSSLYKIDASTGAATLIGNIGFNSVCGLAIQLPPPPPPPPPAPPPVPPPAPVIPPTPGPEGNYPGCSGSSGPEGSFGLGGKSKNIAGGMLLGPFLEGTQPVFGNGNRIVLNVAHRKQSEPEAQQKPQLGKSLMFVAVAVGVIGGLMILRIRR